MSTKNERFIRDAVARERFRVAVAAYESHDERDRAEGDRLHAAMIAAYDSLPAFDRKQMEREAVAEMVDRFDAEAEREWIEDRA